MNIRYALILPFAVSILATGCATVPSDPESQAKLAANLGPVLRDEPGDNQLPCSDLGAQIQQMKWDLSALNLQITQAQNESAGFAIMGALAGMSGATANTFSQVRASAAEGAVANAGGAISGAQGMSKAAIAGTYEARYEALVGIFNGKGCPSPT